MSDGGLYFGGVLCIAMIAARAWRPVPKPTNTARGAMGRLLMIVCRDRAAHNDPRESVYVC